MFDPRRIVELVVLIHPSVHLKIKKKKKEIVSRSHRESSIF